MVFKNTKVHARCINKETFLKQIDFCIFVSNLIFKKSVIFNLYNNAFCSHFLIAFLSLYLEAIMDGILLKYEGNI